MPFTSSSCLRNLRVFAPEKTKDPRRQKGGGGHEHDNLAGKSQNPNPEHDNLAEKSQVQTQKHDNLAEKPPFFPFLFSLFHSPILDHPPSPRYPHRFRPNPENYMKIALDWIADYLAPVPDPQTAADALMNAGLPVESITDAQGSKGPTKVLDVEVTSNRTDCFSHVGLARELAALTGGGGGRFSPPKIQLTESPNAPATNSQIAITVEDPNACPYYSARILRNHKVPPSPDWLVKRLESIGLRPVNNIVDITNYVLMELGQPLHAFDLAKLQANGEGQIVVRPARPNEKFHAIDDKTYTLDPSMLVIADANSPVAVAGVMGGKDSEVTEQTTSILLEAARFDPLSVRTTSRALGLKSDSSYRFERGLDPTLADLASKRAAQLILEIAGTDRSELAPQPLAVGSANYKAPTVSMRFTRFEKITGLKLSPDRAMAILAALGFSPWIDDNEGETEDRVCTRIPSHRLDVDREIDLIEEVARVMGYHHIPTLDRVTHPVSPEPAAEKAARTVATTLTEAGFSEAVTVTFIPQADAKPFIIDAGGATTQLIHPQHAGWKSDVLRPSLLPSLLAVRRTNQYAGIPDARVFEKGETFLQSANPAAAPIRSRNLAAVASDLSALTALLQLLPDRLNGTQAVKLIAVPRNFPFYQKGASAEIHLTTTDTQLPMTHDQLPILGHVGLFTPDLQKKYDLKEKVAGLEINYDALLAIFTATRRAIPVPRFPAIQRDLSIVIDEPIRWADIKAALLATNLPNLAAIDFVTTFRSKDIGANKKSLTLTLDFRDPARTLKSEEVDPQVQSALATLTQKFNATLRA
jgi:phenylalanyl-tRNA synthetase beta chain